MRRFLVASVSVLFCLVGASQDIAQNKGKYGISYEGKWLVKPKFTQNKRLSDEGAKVSCFSLKNEEGKFDIYYLVKGEELGKKFKELEFSYDAIELLTEQIARTKKGELYGIMQVDNWKTNAAAPAKEILRPECSELTLWSAKAGDKAKREHSAVWFTLNKKHGLVLNVGTNLAPKYRIVVTGADEIAVFKSNDQLLSVNMGGKIGLFDLYQYQRYVFPPKYESIESIDFNEKSNTEGAYFIVSEYNKKGLSYIDLNEETQLLGVEFDEIAQVGKTGLFKLKKDNKVGISNLILSSRNLKELCRVGYDSLKLVGYSESKYDDYYVSLQFDGLKGFARILPEEGGVFEMLSIPEFEEIHSFRKSKKGGLSYVVKKDGAYGYKYFITEETKWDVESIYERIVSLDHQGNEIFFCFKKDGIDINPHQKKSRLLLSAYRELSHEALEHYHAKTDLARKYFRIDFYNFEKRKVAPLENFKIIGDSAVFEIKTAIPDSVLDCCLRENKLLIELGDKQLDLSDLLFELPVGPRFKNNLLSYEDQTLRIYEWLEAEKKISLATYYFKSDTLMSRTFGSLVDSYAYEDKVKTLTRKELSGDKKKELRSKMYSNDQNQVNKIELTFGPKAKRIHEFEYDSTGISSIKTMKMTPETKKLLGQGIWKFNRDTTGLLQTAEYLNNTGMPSSTKEAAMDMTQYTFAWSNYGSLASILCENTEAQPCELGSEFKIERDKEGKFAALVIFGPEEGQTRRVSDVHVIEALPFGKFILPSLVKAPHF